MQKNDLTGILEAIGELNDKFSEVSNALRSQFPRLYDRWKAGGCAVSNDFLSAYPSIVGIEEQLQEELEEYCDTCEENPCICEDDEPEETAD